MRLLRRSPKPIRLETKRFVLKSLTRRELARISFPWTSDPEVMVPLEFKAGGWTLRSWERKIMKANTVDKFAFGIEERNSGAYIGYESAQISRTNVALLAVAIGDRRWWGQKVVLESRSAVLDFLFNDRNCVRAWGIASARNFPSISNYQMLGFRHEGVLRGHSSLPGDERGDALVFGILRDEWLARPRSRIGP